jgi:uncharacterized membrane protein YidH (DUF202 family)
MGSFGVELNPVLVSTMAVFALVAGAIGWRRATKPIYRRSYADTDVPDGMTRRDYDRIIRRQRKRWRLFITIMYAIAGAIGGIIFLLILARR